jgi:carbon storage regulator
MLVLSRKPGETIKIADGLITLAVKHVRGNVVSLGFEAPNDIKILRGELSDTLSPNQEKNGGQGPCKS